MAASVLEKMSAYLIAFWGISYQYAGIVIVPLKFLGQAALDCALGSTEYERDVVVADNPVIVIFTVLVAEPL